VINAKFIEHRFLPLMQLIQFGAGYFHQFAPNAILAAHKFREVFQRIIPNGGETERDQLFAILRVARCANHCPV